MRPINVNHEIVLKNKLQFTNIADAAA